MSTPDNIGPHQTSFMGTAVVTTVTHKFKNLEIRDRSTISGQCDNYDPLSIIKPFESLDIGSGSPGQIGHNSVQTTAADSIRTSPPTNRIHTTIQRPNHHTVLHTDVSSNAIGSSQDDIDEQISEGPDLDEWTDCLAARKALFKERKRRIMAARKRLSRGPTRKKIGGVGRHRSARPHRLRL